LLEAHPVRAFDVIVVDGQLREETTALAFELLAQKGALSMTPKATRVSLTKFEKGIAGRLTFLGSAQAYRCDTAHPSFLSKTVFSSAPKYKFRC
jgi:hypothetical protein